MRSRPLVGDPASALAARAPDIEGRSKRIWLLDDRCVVELIPSLRSFTYDRDELVEYPGLFPPHEPLPRPVVKFDYRVDPEDQPIGEDYLRALGVPVKELRRLALKVNTSLCAWLHPIEVWDFCLIFGLDAGGAPVLISEVSPDCMRLRHPDGSSLDKDLFRHGGTPEEITAAWRSLLDELD